MQGHHGQASIYNVIKPCHACSSDHKPQRTKGLNTMHGALATTHSTQPGATNAHAPRHPEMQSMHVRVCPVLLISYLFCTHQRYTPA